jgi:hypothetical protein
MRKSDNNSLKNHGVTEGNNYFSVVIKRDNLKK